MGVVNRSLPELESERAALLARLGELGDFRRGSVTENWRRCGKANCACAAEDHPGHGPRWLWQRTLPGGRKVARQLSPGEVDKVRAELEAYHAFAQLSDQLVTVNEAICEARPVEPPGTKLAGKDQDADSDGEKGGSRAGSGTRSRRRSRPSSTG
jgi:Family of unknown function (DUF6788)